MKTWLLVAVCGLVGCGGSNPLRPIAQGIAAATTTARSVSLALAAVDNAPASCVSVASACTAFPCTTSVTIDVGGCPMPLSVANTGTITVHGMWTTASEATVSVQLVDVKIAAEKDAVALETVRTVTATSSGDTATVKFSGADAGARSGLDAAAIGGANNWTVGVSGLPTGGTSFDVDASSASVSGLANVNVTTLSAVHVDDGCALNPTSGSGDITSVHTIIPSIDRISFHGACDGKGTVNGNTHDFDVSP